MKVRINNNAPTKSQKNALRKECVKEFDKLLELYNKQVALQVLYILRFDFEFGQNRLEKFSKKLEEMQIKTIDRYEIDDEDVPNICEIKLKESGIDISKLVKGFEDGDNGEKIL